MTEPVKLPERNWEQEAISLIAVEAGYSEEVLTAIVEGYRDGWGVQDDVDAAIAVRECAARLESDARVAELTRQVESLQQERDDFREGFRLFLRKSECMTEQDADGEIFSWVKEVRDDRPEA